MRKREEPKVEKFVNDIHCDSVERHPAFAQIGASRVHGSTHLYASDFKHNAYMTVTIRRSDAKRNLSNDWFHAGEELIEVAMSESQWATFISTPNSGQGTPCTLQFYRPEGDVPGIVHPTKKTEQFTQETTKTLKGTLASLRNALKVIEDLPGLSKAGKKALAAPLAAAIQDLEKNLGFVADQFIEHVEAVTDAARTEIHAYIESAISRAGLRAIAAGTERPFEVPSFEPVPVVKTFPEPGDEQ